MQSSLVDQKLSVLFDKYQDREFVANSQKEVEDIRKKALYVGGATTTAGFVLNEVTRLTMRSRKFQHFNLFQPFSSLRLIMQLSGQSLLLLLASTTMIVTFMRESINSGKFTLTEQTEVSILLTKLSLHSNNLITTLFLLLRIKVLTSFFRS